MMHGLRSLSCFCIVSALILQCPECAGQGLLFNLPEDGVGVEYQGTMTQENVRSDLADGKETLTWRRELTIKSVGREDAEFEGTTQPCRWIEIKVLIGTGGAAGIDPGPVGARIYKILVPESKIIADPVDSDSIPNHMLHIVRGFRRTGENRVVQIRSPALRIYPTISLLTNYDNVEIIANSDIPQTRDTSQSYSAKRMRGTMVMERQESRSTNVGEFWLSNDVPFGLARWEVKVTREEKESTATRDKFRPVSTVTSEMSVLRKIVDAESELVTD